MTSTTVLTDRAKRSAHQLLLDYSSASSLFFASPNRTLHGQGIWQLRHLQNNTSLATHAQELLQEAKQQGKTGRIVAGAIPFEKTGLATLVVPKILVEAEKLPEITQPTPQFSLRGARMHAVPSATEYQDMVNSALQRFQSTKLRKVVLARTLDVHFEGQLELSALICALAKRNPSGYTFALNTSSGRTVTRLIGASPELLITKTGHNLSLQPMAGTRPRHPDPQQDLQQAEELRTSHKDLQEHQIVIDAIRAVLTPLCSTLHVPQVPQLVQTPNLWHLATPITGTLLDPHLSVLDLVHMLHPTPAVCGTPTQLARETIHDLEPFDRGFFAGAVGWCDENGDGEWAVTIRCAEVEDGRLRLFAGAGIVPESQAAQELQETHNKLGTLLSVLGLQEQL